MTRYFRVSLGEQGKDSALALREGWIGTGWMADIDLTNALPETHAMFRKKFNPVILHSGEVKTPIAAGLACGMTFTVAAYMKQGDIVLSGKPNGDYQVGKVTGPYYYAKGQPQPHRRPVEWFGHTIKKSHFSPELRKSLSIGTVQAWVDYKDLEKQAAFEAELSRLAKGDFPDNSTQNYFDEEIRFHAEMELEDFLEKHWSKTSFAKDYDFVTRQMQLDDAGRLDILARSKDGSEYLIIELKLGRASDRVVGQLQSYMGYFLTSGYCANGETVRGVIIGASEDPKIRHALKVTNNIEFYVYEMQFNLKKII
jgi:restriction system protein